MLTGATCETRLILMSNAADIIRPRTPAYTALLRRFRAADQAYTIACNEADFAGVDIYGDSACREAAAEYRAADAAIAAVAAATEARRTSAKRGQS